MNWTSVPIALALTLQVATTPPVENPRPAAAPLQIVNFEGCPIVILERKSRVVDARALNVHADQRGAGSGMYSRKNWGAIERQIVFDLAFRNESGQAVLAAEFAWVAYDEAGKLIDRRTQRYDGDAVGVGSVGSAHALGLPIANGAERYRLQVRGVLMADGTMWMAPVDPLESDGTP